MATKDEVRGRLSKTKMKKPNTYTLFVAIDMDTTSLVLFADRTVTKAMRAIIRKVDEERYTEDAHGDATNPAFPKDLRAAIWDTAEEADSRFQGVHRIDFNIEDLFRRDLQLYRFKLSRRFNVYDAT